MLPTRYREAIDHIFLNCCSFQGNWTLLEGSTAIFHIHKLHFSDWQKREKCHTSHTKNRPNRIVRIWTCTIKTGLAGHEDQRDSKTYWLPLKKSWGLLKIPVPKHAITSGSSFVKLSAFQVSSIVAGFIMIWLSIKVSHL